MGFARARRKRREIPCDNLIPNRAAAKEAAEKTQMFVIPRRAARPGIPFCLHLDHGEIPRFARNDKINHVFAGTARPGVAGTSGPRDRSQRLSLASRRAARWTVTTQRARTHSQSRADRRRNIAERRAAIAAEFSHGVGSPQPVAASGAFRIDALHSPSRQILHEYLPLAAAGMTRQFFRSRRTFPACRTRWP